MTVVEVTWVILTMTDVAMMTGIPDETVDDPVVTYVLVS
jgi:hypothetical protein